MRVIALSLVILLGVSVASAQTIYSSKGTVITYYVPHNSPNCKNSIEGCIETSRPGLNGRREPACLDAVRLGKAKYVTLASAESNYGRYFSLGTITYRSALDNQMHTVQNVVGYVHDTGCAFNGTCKSGNFSKVPRPDKIDVCTTICPTCSDSQAGAYAQGKNVNILQSQDGVYDPSIFTQRYGDPSNPYSPFGVSPFSSSQGASPGGGALGTQGATAGYGATPVSSQIGAGNSPLGVSIGGSGSSDGSGGGSSSGNGDGTTGLSASTIVVQPKNARAGLVIVSWTSVNMKPSSCKVTKDGKEFATGNEATKRDTISKSVEYALECTTPTGETAVSKASVSI